MHSGIESVKLRSEHMRTQTHYSIIFNIGIWRLFFYKTFTYKIHNSTIVKMPIYCIAVDVTLTALIIQAG